MTEQDEKPLLERYVEALADMRREYDQRGCAHATHYAVKHGLPKREFSHLLGAVVCRAGADERGIQLTIFENTFLSSELGLQARAVAAVQALAACSTEQKPLWMERLADLSRGLDLRELEVLDQLQSG